MKKFFTNFRLLAVAILLSASLSVHAQSSSDTVFKPHGTLWGYAFGDFAYKGNADTAGFAKNAKYRGGSNQYTNVNWANNGQNMNLFQLRRAYLGYNYDISPKFSAEFLLAAEDDFNSAAPTTYTATSTSTTTITGAPGAAATTKTTTTVSVSNPASNQNGDLLADGKLAPYLKLANVRWKQIYPGADLVIGEVATPSFPLLSEVVWNYRSIERTVSDIRRTPSFDLGVTLQGRFIPKNDNYGYNVMVGNGQSAKIEANAFKWFYGDVYAKFFNKHLIVDLYQDYYRLNWTPTYHHDRNMTKIFIAWTEPKFTVGVEAFTNTLMGDVAATGAADGKTYYFNTVATAVSLYARGKIYKDKLGFFARYDTYDPTKNLSAFDNPAQFSKYSASTSQYDPTNKENFMTLGLDYTPIKNVHIMPNIWYDSYSSSNGFSPLPNGNDMVYRLTFYFIFGK